MIKKLALALAFAAMTSSAQAGLTATYGYATTNWTIGAGNTSLGIDQFNSTLGTLTAIHVSFSTGVKSDIKFESLDAADATVSATASAAVSLSTNTGSSIFNLTPFNTSTTSVTAFDGLIDFGGTSGKTLPTITGTASDSTILTDATSLAAFSAVGGGTYYFQSAALGNSSVSGAGNLISQINTSAQVTVTVSYDYTPVEITPPSVPEPTTVLAALFGVVPFVVARRRLA